MKVIWQKWTKPKTSRICMQDFFVAILNDFAMQKMWEICQIMWIFFGFGFITCHDFVHMAYNQNLFPTSHYEFSVLNSEQPKKFNYRNICHDIESLRKILNSYKFCKLPNRFYKTQLKNIIMILFYKNGLANCKTFAV